MCGIVGISNFQQQVVFQEKSLATSLKNLSQRGPDFSRIYVSQHVALGHARLAIIDTSAEAHQPFANTDNNVVLVFNGEIYNYKEIKKSLEQKGYLFRTNSDTEVLLYLYIEKGIECLQQLNGDFAFAIYDKRNESLFIARDRFGVKPLYYAIFNDTLYFSSELKGLLPLLNFVPEMNIDAFLFYLQLNYIPAPFSIYNNIFKLKPGYFIYFNRNKCEIKSYYSIPSEINENISERQAIETFKELFIKSVEKRLISDVPIGSFLSGGLDSSITTAVAKQFKSDIEAFTISFKNQSFFDESSDAKQVAKHLNIRHNIIPLEENDLLNIIPLLFEYLDEPFADSSAIAVSALAQYTKKHITVALSGDGADELLGGYYKHYAHALAFKQYKYRFLWYPISEFLKILPQSRNNSVLNKIRQINKFADGLKYPHKERYWKWATTFHSTDINKILLNVPKYPDCSVLLKTEASTLHQVLLNDMYLVLPNDMLFKTDSMTMMHSLEARVPMLDHELVNFTFTLPVKYKIQTKNRKIILKKAFGQLLPQSLLNKPKHGFEVPLQQWLKTYLASYINEYTSKSFIEKQQIFNYEHVQKLIRKLHSVHPSESAIHLWNFLVFQHWWEKTYC